MSRRERPGLTLLGSLSTTSSPSATRVAWYTTVCLDSNTLVASLYSGSRRGKGDVIV